MRPIYIAPKNIAEINLPGNFTEISEMFNSLQAAWKFILRSFQKFHFDGISIVIRYMHIMQIREVAYNSTDIKKLHQNSISMPMRNQVSCQHACSMYSIIHLVKWRYIHSSFSSFANQSSQSRKVSPHQPFAIRGPWQTPPHAEFVAPTRILVCISRQNAHFLRALPTDDFSLSLGQSAWFPFHHPMIRLALLFGFNFAS